MTTRTRTRAIAVDERVTEAMKVAAVEVRAFNKAKNDATRDEKKAQEKLDQLMAQADKGKPWKFTYAYGGGKKLTAEYARGTKSSVNIPALAKLITQKEFLEVVSASQKAVEETCGKNTLNQVIDTEDGNWKATVKELKS